MNASFSILAALPAEFVDSVPLNVGELASYVLAAGGMGLTVFVALRIPVLISRSVRAMIDGEIGGAEHPDEWEDENGVTESYTGGDYSPWFGPHPSEWENEDGTTESVHGESSSWSPDKSMDWAESWEMKRDELREEIGGGYGPAWDEYWEAEHDKHAKQFNDNWEPSEADPDHKVLVMEGYSAKPYDGPEAYEDGREISNDNPFSLPGGNDLENAVRNAERY